MTRAHQHLHRHHLHHHRHLHCHHSHSLQCFVDVSGCDRCDKKERTADHGSIPVHFGPRELHERKEVEVRGSACPYIIHILQNCIFTQRFNCCITYPHVVSVSGGAFGFCLCSLEKLNDSKSKVNPKFTMTDFVAQQFHAVSIKIIRS